MPSPFTLTDHSFIVGLEFYCFGSKGKEITFQSDFIASR